MHHREYDLRGASVMLEPDYLPRRWLWSRKYPICVKLKRPTNSAVQSSIPAKEDLSCADTPSDLADGNCSSDGMVFWF